MTNEPKKKPSPVDPVALRARDVADIVKRTNEPGNMLTPEAIALAAWDAGYNAGARR